MVLAAAKQLAELTHSKLVLFRAVSIPPDLPHTVFEVSDVQLEEMLLGNARADLQLRAKEAEGFVEKIHCVFGTAWDSVCREAKECNADLIVIGSHGHSLVARMVGTTAAKIVNHADRNVLVIRTLL
jgi:nucleotide-binding universal stress UspA family protein